MSILEGAANQFRGVVVKPEALMDSPREFQEVLHQSIKTWQSEGLRLVWLEVPIGKSALIPVAVATGFEFHHSGADYLMLTRRLIPDAHIPPYASHYIGAGGVVLRKNRDKPLS